jgi:hypothetical protein
MHFNKVEYDLKFSHSKVLLISHAVTALYGYNHPWLTKVTCHHYAIIFAAETNTAFVMFITLFFYKRNNDKTSTACLIFTISFVTPHHA